MSAPLSGKFAVHVPPGFHNENRKILYIGKATAGEFKEPDVSAMWFNNIESPFWRFARKVSALASSNTAKDLRNLAWSNIFKQGVTSRNPGGNLAKQQWHDAVRALREEAANLKPDLIVLVNAGYYEEIPREAFDIPQVGENGRALEETPVPGEQYSIWWRKRIGTSPAIVWMNHPQGKTTAYIEAALDVICTATGWGEKSQSVP